MIGDTDNQLSTSPDRDTVVGVLDHASRTWPERVFLEFGGETRTYREFADMVRQLANGLKASGVSRNDAVCVCMSPSIDAVAIWFAINTLGAVHVPLNIALRAAFLAHQVADSEPRVIIADSDYASFIIEESQCSKKTPVFVRNRGADHDWSVTHDFQELYAAPAYPTDIEVASEDLAMILYTSGTTGPSKGCMVSHRYACFLAGRVASSLKLTCDDISWSCLPLFHVFGIAGIVLSSMTVGARVVLHKKFSLSNFWSEIWKSRATVVHLVGSMITLIGTAVETEAEKLCFGQLRVAVGIPFSRESIDLWKRRFGVGCAATPGYGLTEAARITEVSLDVAAEADTCGKPTFFDVRIFDGNDRECERGVAGEIVVRPLRPGIMFDGYWRRPVDTQMAFQNLWFHTGDIGRIDQAGNLLFVDRKKDYVRRRGENISSYEVEAAFLRHPSVRDVAAFGVPSPVSEEDLIVSVVLAPLSEISESELYEWAGARMPSFCVPRYIEIRDELPKSATGKTLKYILKEQGLTEKTWDSTAAAARIPYNPPVPETSGNLSATG